MIIDRDGLSGRGALVTGAASGIGRACALALGAVGAHVIVADRDAAGIERTVQLVTEAGGVAIGVEMDVSQEDSVRHAVDVGTARVGALACAVNSAGVNGLPLGIADTPTDEWERVIGVDLTGVYLSMKYELRTMLEAGAGSIVNIASVAGLTSAGASAAYIASKHGVVGLTRAATKEYTPRGVRVNAICPGTIETPLLADVPRERRLLSAPAGRDGEADEIADAALWLCGNRSSYVSGAEVVVDGGWIHRGC